MNSRQKKKMNYKGGISYRDIKVFDRRLHLDLVPLYKKMVKEGKRTERFRSNSFAKAYFENTYCTKLPNHM